MQKIIKVLKIIKYAIFDSDNFLLKIIENEANCYLDQFVAMDVRNTEDFEDLLYHIRSYMDLPETLKSTLYDTSEEHSVLEYIEDLERLRAVEREYIFDLVKTLPIGFEL